MKQIADLISSATGRIHKDLDLYEVLSDALGVRYASDQKVLRELDQRARRSTYVSVVIACYGVIEQTVDEMIMSAAATLNGIYSTHSALPEKVRKDHRELVLRCLIDGERARTRIPVEEAAALASLGVGPDSAPNLLGSVFTLSSANYRWGYVAQLFGRLSLLISESMDKIEDDIAARTGFNSFESFLTDLVQRRNDVAHSYGDIDTLAPDLLRAYIDAVSDYLRAVDVAVTHELLLRVTEVSLTPIGEVVHRWDGRVGIVVESGEIAQGNLLLLVKDRQATLHTIRSLQSEGRDGEAFAAAGESINVGAAVDWAPANCVGSRSFIMDDRWVDLFPRSSDGGP